MQEENVSNNVLELSMVEEGGSCTARREKKIYQKSEDNEIKIRSIQDLESNTNMGHLVPLGF